MVGWCNMLCEIHWSFSNVLKFLAWVPTTLRFSCYYFLALRYDLFLSFYSNYGKWQPCRSGMALRAVKNVSLLSFWALINGAPLFSTFCPDFRERERPKWSEEEERREDCFCRHFTSSLFTVSGNPANKTKCFACIDPRYRLLNLTLRTYWFELIHWFLSILHIPSFDHVPKYISIMCHAPNY